MWYCLRILLPQPRKKEPKLIIFWVGGLNFLPGKMEIAIFMCLSVRIVTKKGLLIGPNDCGGSTSGLEWSYSWLINLLKKLNKVVSLQR